MQFDAETAFHKVTHAHEVYGTGCVHDSDIGIILDNLCQTGRWIRKRSHQVLY